MVNEHCLQMLKAHKTNAELTVNECWMIIFLLSVKSIV